MSTIERLKDGYVKVAVLCGGPGAEREVSLLSGDMAHHALVEAGLPNQKIEVPQEDYEAYLDGVDCQVAVMMLHGEWGEDGGAQAILERRGIAFSGSDARVSALAMDKGACKSIFVEKGIPTAPWQTGRSVAELAGKVRDSGLRPPYFVKPNFRGSSVGASRVDDLEQLPAAIENALAEDREVMVEEMVVGRELTVGWLDGVVLPPIELAAENVFYDYEAKYLSNETRYQCPAPLIPAMDKEVRNLAARVVELIGARDVARVDIMLGVDGPMVLEINTLPGFTSHSLLPMAAAAAGIDTKSLCLRLVEMAANRSGMLSI